MKMSPDNKIEIRPASTLILMRSTDRVVDNVEFEVFMLRRNLNSDFVGGAFVFPGGGVLADDFDEKILKRCINFSAEINDSKFKLERGGSIGYFVAAIRETFEEAGILVGLAEHNNNIDFDEYRSRLNSKEIKFSEFLESEDIYLDLSTVYYFSHWTTPVGPPRRYSTRFFVSAIDPKFELSHDNGETIEAKWINPKLALNLYEKGEFEIIFPTARNLEKLVVYKTRTEVVENVSKYDNILETVPRITADGDEIKILIPGDEGY
jgi:8-oxo-dGTP pyrophosphatase MutT (NUDIX family)